MENGKKKPPPMRAAAQRVKKAPNIRCHSEPVRLSGVGIPRIEVKATGLGSKMFENSGDCHGSVRTASQ